MSCHRPDTGDGATTIRKLGSYLLVVLQTGNEVSDIWWDQSRLDVAIGVIIGCVVNVPSVETQARNQ